MKVKYSNAKKTLIVEVQGDFIENLSDDITSRVHECDYSSVAFNLSGTHFINSVGISTFAILLDKKNTKIILIGLNSHLEQAFKSNGLLSFMSVSESLKTVL